MSTSIEWTNETWNPVVGCRAYSAGCANCYAEVMSTRLRGMALADIEAGRKPGRKAYYLNVIDPDRGGWNSRVVPVPEALNDPHKWRVPRRVFVNSMSDLFYGDDADRRACESKRVAFTPVTVEWIGKVFDVMAMTPRHTFQILTKRTARMAEVLPKLAARHTAKDGTGWPLPNVWLGTSTENQKTYDERAPHLRQTPAAIRFLSIEPQLGPIDLGDDFWESGNRIDWVIVGGESGPGARPFNVQWARDIVDQCKAAGVACFVKQMGAYVVRTSEHGPDIGIPLKDKKGGDWSEWSDDLKVREFPSPALATV